MGNLKAEMDKIEKNISDAEREIFADFSSRVDIEDVQDYERRKHKDKEEFDRKLADYQVLIASLKNQQEFHKKTSKKADPDHFKQKKKELQDTIAADEEEMKRLTKAEKKVTDAMQQTKDEMQATKKQMVSADSEMKTIKGSTDTELAELFNLKKEHANQKAYADKLRRQRLVLCRKCKVDGVSPTTIPVADRDTTAPKRKKKRQPKRSRKKQKGDDGDDPMDEDDEEDDDEMDEDEDPDVSAPVRYSEPIGLSQLDLSTPEDKALKASTTDDDAVCIDFTGLDEKLQQIAGKPKKFSKRAEEFEIEIADLTDKAEKSAPNMKALERFEEVDDELDAKNRDYQEAKEEHQEASRAFEAIKEKRSEKFRGVVEKVGEHLARIYKNLTKDINGGTEWAGGTALLSYENGEEPYAGGIKFTAQPPKKRVLDMEALSGGEKTMAALALLFSIQAVRPAPFFILDEVDAALDAENVIRVRNYICEQQRQGNSATQFIVISLKPEFFFGANALFGVSKHEEQDGAAASKILSWGLEGAIGDDEEGSGQGTDMTTETGTVATSHNY
eukprot:TRINITY_DN54231_c0_g1_i1.p1 TRINITY_DN54231_c0_g1~~TRINITY_DN54231_c0_g1_i1.p1  ORF type:complete len:613 (-),score=138.40 TRINITY_DN54231_c0_g1_i1:50-1726(-)